MVEPYKADLIVAYDTYVAAFEKRFDSTFREVTEPFFQRFVQTIPGKRVLDLGSGAGSNAVLFTKKGFDVTCIDLSQKMVERCMKKGLCAIQGDMEEVQFSPNSFDGIWAYCSLLHLKRENIPRMVECLSTWLKKDGLLGVGFLDEGRADESREDKSYPGVHRWFSYYKMEEIPLFFANHFDIIFEEKKSAKRSNGNPFYYLHVLMRKK